MIALCQDISMHVKKKNDGALTLLCSPRYLIACHISPHNTRLQLHSFTKIPLEHLEFEKLIVFNPTRIALLIENLIKSLNLAHLPLFVGLYGPTIKNSFANLPTAHPTIQQLPISHTPHWQWEYAYLYPHDHSYYFYICGIPRELIFQCQLLALKYNWKLNYLTSERMALLQLYKYLFGHAFRPTQLGIHMQQKNNNVDALFSRDDLSRIITIPSHISVNEYDIGNLLTSCGLFIGGESYA